MKIHKQAAIKTAIILLSFFVLTFFLAFVIINIPEDWILPLIGIIFFTFLIRAIYKIILNDIEFKERIVEREQEWKRLDEERYRKKTLYEKLGE